MRRRRWASAASSALDDLGAAGEEAGEGVVAEAEQLRLGDGRGGHRARAGVEEAELAEHLAGAEDRDEVLAAVGARAAELDLALGDDVERVAPVALVEEHVAALHVETDSSATAGPSSLVVKALNRGARLTTSRSTGSVCQNRCACDLLPPNPP